MANITLVNPGEVLAWNILAQSRMVNSDAAKMAALTNALLSLASTKNLTATQLDIMEAVLQSITAYSSSVGYVDNF